MSRWLIGEDSDIEANMSQLEDVVPHWREISGLALGQIQSLNYRRLRDPTSPARPNAGSDAFARRFTFDDAHMVVGSITRSFGPYWEGVCQEMKGALVKMDKKGTGRVKLSSFYGGALDSEWRFGESEAYLRQLGALDESSRWHGKQVLIANYLQAASNCIVTSSHYHVCCQNECEGLMGEIEAQIREPVAAPQRLLGVVGNLSSPSSDFDAELRLSQSIKAQLRQIA